MTGEVTLWKLLHTICCISLKLKIIKQLFEKTLTYIFFFIEKPRQQIIGYATME